MTPSAQLHESITLLDAAFSSGKPADRILHTHFKSNRFIGSHDRQAISEFFYGVIRHYQRLSWHCQALSVEASARTLLLAYLLLAAKKTRRELDTLFSGGRHAPDILNLAERAFLNQLMEMPLRPEAMPDSTALECPAWLEIPLTVQYGVALKPLLNALLQPAAVDLRVNPLRATREAMLEELRGAGLEAEPTRFSPLGLRVPSRFAYNQLAALQDGRVEVQDESSQLGALFVDVAPGMAVLDLCAGAGGKTLLLAALMKNKGRLVATDVSEKRLIQCERRLKKARVDNTTVRLLDKRWCDNNAAKFDRVLIDAPCTGSGTWRRNPDARLRYGAEDLLDMQQTQQQLLRQGAALVKPGGRLIYSTCSLLAAENDEQMRFFASEFPQFSGVSLAELAAKNGILGLTVGEGDNSIQLLPHPHGTDGFFVSVWRKTEANRSDAL